MGVMRGQFFFFFLLTHMIMGRDSTCDHGPQMKNSVSQCLMNDQTPQKSFETEVCLISLLILYFQYYD